MTNPFNEAEAVAPPVPAKEPKQKEPKEPPKPRWGACACGHERFGYIVENGVLRKRVKVAEHQLKKPPAWALQASVYDFHANGVTEVVLTEEETGRIWRVGRALFERRRWKLDRGAGEQYALELRYWRLEDPACQQLVLL